MLAMRAAYRLMIRSRCEALDRRQEDQFFHLLTHPILFSSIDVIQDVLLVQDSWSKKLMDMERCLQNKAQKNSSLEAKLAAQDIIILGLRASDTTDQTDHVELMEMRAENEALKSKARL